MTSAFPFCDFRPRNEDYGNMVQLLPQSVGCSQNYGPQGETQCLSYWQCPDKPLDGSPKT